MANARYGDALRQVETLFRVGAVGELSDRQLLERFEGSARRGEPGRGETAFAALVERHGRMVLGTCRTILSDRHAAEDAFQATFLILARRAGSLWVGDSLGPWLHAVAVRVASSARAAAARQRARERQAGEAGATREWSVPPVDEPGNELGAVLQEEIDRLPPRYRTAVVLCCCEGLTHEQAAQQLAWPVGTVRSRLARGRARLRDRLARRGVAPAGGALGASLLAHEAHAALPMSLTPLLTQAALRLAAGETLAGIVPVRVTRLVAEVSRMRMLIRVLSAASLLIVTGIVAAGITAIAGQAPSPPPRDDRGPLAQATPEPRPKPAPKPEATPNPEASPAELSPDSFPPVVVKTEPAPGARDVDPALGEIRVTFNKLMSDKSWSWVQQSPETFPEGAGKVHYEPGMQTCVMPVKLTPGKTYVVWINSQRFHNFRDAGGNSAVPYLLVFQTRKR